MAIQNLGQFISSPFQIASLTKHIIDNKLSSAYQAEADREVCKVQAGFDKDEPWFVPESNLDCTASLAAFERHLLPEIDHWRSEAKNQNGDKSSCADDFLHQVLPFLVEVVVQCGIYFIKDFPQHPFGELLKQMNGYEQWARNSRIQCKIMIDNRLPNQCKLFNLETRGAIERFSLRIDNMAIQQKKMAICQDSIKMLLSQLIESNKQVTEMLLHQEQQWAHHWNGASLLIPPVGVLGQQQQQNDLPPPATQVLTTHQQQQDNFMGSFRHSNDPRKPVMSTELPKSYGALLHEWRTNNLSSFLAQKSKTANWGDAVHLRFSKRLKLYSTIEARAAAMGQTLDESAAAMDAERECVDAHGRGNGKFLTLNQKLSECRSAKRCTKRPRLHPKT